MASDAFRLVCALRVHAPHEGWVNAGSDSREVSQRTQSYSLPWIGVFFVYQAMANYLTNSMSTGLKFSESDVEHSLSRSASRAQDIPNPSCNTSITCSSNPIEWSMNLKKETCQRSRSFTGSQSQLLELCHEVSHGVALQ
jgi:hypothetical protein